MDILFSGDRIEKIVISGDFFLHPEDAIEIIERELTGKSLDDLDAYFSGLPEKGWVLIGASWDDLCNMLKSGFSKKI